jgi:hypothetical protein
MKVTLLIGALAVAKATDPGSPEACFVDNGVLEDDWPHDITWNQRSWNVTCGACREIVLANDPVLVDDPSGGGGILDCLCSQTAVLAAAGANRAIDGHTVIDGHAVVVDIMDGCVGAGSAMKMEEAARALGIRVEVAALPEKTSHPSAVPAGAILFLGVAAIAAVVVTRRRAAAAADEAPVAPMI